MKHSEHFTGGKCGLVFFSAALSFPLQHYYFREPTQWLLHSQVQGSHGGSEECCVSAWVLSSNCKLWLYTLGRAIKSKEPRISEPGNFRWGKNDFTHTSFTITFFFNNKVRVFSEQSKQYFCKCLHLNINCLLFYKCLHKEITYLVQPLSLTACLLHFR